MSCENISEICQESWRDQIRHQLEVMNINRKLGFAERLAKSVRLFAHPAIDEQREDVMGIGEI